MIHFSLVIQFPVSHAHYVCIDMFVENGICLKSHFKKEVSLLELDKDKK